MADPWRRNSGFEATSNSTPAGACRRTVAATRAPVSTGIVDFSTMRRYAPGRRASATCRADVSTYERSACPSSRGGVGTEMKRTSER